MKTGDICDALESDGFVHLRCFMPDMSTRQVAEAIGQITDHRLLAGVTDSVVQQLKPRPKTGFALHRYYGHFGFEEYPAHTDLAHWIVPPRYLVLRARNGASQVATHVYNQRGSLRLLDTKLLNSAIFAPSNVHRALVPMAMRVCKELPFSIRWDPLFIQPINDSAKKCASVVHSADFAELRFAVVLEEHADTLIIDNWRALHGRGAVPPEATNRRVDRIYLDALHGYSG
jgi:hypothetical protein